MDEYIEQIVTGFVSFVFALLFRYFEQKPNLCYWFPHQFTFDQIEGNLTIKTDSITIQNLGNKPSEQIEVIHKSKPDYFKIYPSLSYKEETNPNGEHLIIIDSLGPKEFFTIQLLSYKTLPYVMSIRSKEGIAKSIPIIIHRVYPKYIQIAAFLIMAVGAISIVSIIVNVVSYYIDR